MATLRRRWPVAVFLLGLILVVLAVGGLLSNRKPTAHSTLLPPPVQIISPDPVPSGAPTPSPVTTPVDGMRIQVPELGIDLPVVPGDGVNAPLYKAVLDPFLAEPGAGKRSMIYAHAQTGMFGPLFNTRVGQHVIIRRPNKADLQYVITEYHPRWPVNDLSPLQAKDTEQLVLVTCTTYNLNDPRQVVFASPA
ncbi:MAG: sortase [Candidatus Dormibacteria bacterium]